MSIKKGKTKKTSSKGSVVKGRSGVVMSSNTHSDGSAQNTQHAPDIENIHNSTSHTVAGQIPVYTEAAMLMPHTDAEREILQQRAVSLASEENEQGIDGRHMQEYVRFRLGSNEHYGIPYPFMVEIIDVGVITPVPCTPSFVTGVINRRGELLNVLDITSFFRIGKAPNSDADNARILVVHVGSLQTGILVDDVIGSDYYPPDQLTQPLCSDGVSNLGYVKGIHDGKVTLLNLEVMLSDSAIIVNNSGA